MGVKRYESAAWSPDQVGELAVECWCQGDVVRVTPEDIKRGLTGPCHRWSCQRTDARRRRDLRRGRQVTAGA